MASKNNNEDDDRLKELQEFENTKLGVKGLVDSGITRIPRIFHHPPETLFDLHQAVSDDADSPLIPVIDMSIPHQVLVQRVRDASSEFGFFQVINHGVPVALMNRLLDAVEAFHELPAAEKIHIYRRDVATSSSGVGFFSNFDLFVTKAASWRDTFEVRLSPNQFDPSAIPGVCRDEVIEWDKEVKQLGEQIMELLSEGLGLNGDTLKGLSCFDKRSMVANYYPYCPEPTKTVGVTPHTDLGTLTVLLQDQVGGLQLNHRGKWVNLKPVHGALVINIGDFLQMISNDKYKSGEHRVQANPFRTPRLSIAFFFKPSRSNKLHGPLPELVSVEKPAVYQPFRFSDLVNKCLTKGLEGEGMSVCNYFRLKDHMQNYDVPTQTNGDREDRVHFNLKNM